MSLLYQRLSIIVEVLLVLVLVVLLVVLLPRRTLAGFLHSLVCKDSEKREMFLVQIPQ